MKKWIFPLILFILNLVFIILFITPSIVEVLPQFLLWIRELLVIILTGISNLLHLPTFPNGNETNYVVANCISLFILNALILIIYFVVYFIVKKRRPRKTKLSKAIDLPKSEFDPILFEKRVPIFRLVFMWIPLNLYFLYFFLLNTVDLQEKFKESMPRLYAIFAQNIEFYNQNALPLVAKDDAVKFAILVIGLVVVAFVYWMIFSIFAVFFKKPIARAKAKHALREHEKRVNACQQEEVFVENIDILEHAKFVHSKSIVETIAAIDIKQINDENKDKQNYFDDLAHGIIDLGVENSQKLHEVLKPITEKKPLRIILSSVDKTNEYKVVDDKKESIEEEQKEVVPKKQIIFDAKFDVLNENKEEKVNEEPKIETPTNQDNIVKPLEPSTFRKPVKVTPVNPKNIPLKDLVNQEDIIDVESEKNDK